MLNKNKSKQILKLKYVLLIPVLAIMLVYTSCEKSGLTIDKENQIVEGIEIQPRSEEFINERLEKIGEDLEKIDKEIKETKLENPKLESKQKVMEQLYSQLLKERKQKAINIKNEEQVESQVLNEKEVANGVPFAIIDKAPIFPGCEDVEDRKKCLQESIQKHVGKKFNTKLTQTLGLSSGKKRVVVIFKINKNGEIIDVRSRGPHAALEAEAIRVVNSLPKMIPGEYKDRKVSVKYALPISIEVN